MPTPFGTRLLQYRLFANRQSVNQTISVLLRQKERSGITITVNKLKD